MGLGKTVAPVAVVMAAMRRREVAVRKPILAAARATETMAAMATAALTTEAVAVVRERQGKMLSAETVVMEGSANTLQTLIPTALTQAMQNRPPMVLDQEKDISVAVAAVRQTLRGLSVLAGQAAAQTAGPTIRLAMTVKPIQVVEAAALGMR